MECWNIDLKGNAANILNVILIAVTFWYAKLTSKLVKSSEQSVLESKKQTEALSRPYITVQTLLKSHSPMIVLSIKNTGLTGANNLRLSMDRDFAQLGDPRPEGNIRNMKAFTTPIDSFAPDRELTFPLATSYQILMDANESCPPQFIVTATYDFFEKSVREEFHIDLELYRGGAVDIDPLVSEIEKIRKHITGDCD